MEFSFKRSEYKDFPVFGLQGRLMEKAQATTLLQEMDETIKGGKNKIILDLSGMDYMNSSGLNTFINILTKARNSSGEVVLAAVSAKVNDLFLITKLNTLFRIEKDLESAANVLNN